MVVAAGGSYRRRSALSPDRFKVSRIASKQLEILERRRYWEDEEEVGIAGWSDRCERVKVEEVAKQQPAEIAH